MSQLYHYSGSSSVTIKRIYPVRVAMRSEFQEILPSLQDERVLVLSEEHKAIIRTEEVVTLIQAKKLLNEFFYENI